MTRLTVLPIFLLLTGCVQMEVHVKLHEDGSATVRERIWFSKLILEQANPTAEATDLKQELTREAAIQRGSLLADGAKLESHQTSATEEGAESVAIYKVDDIEDLRFHAPFPAVKGHTNGSLHFTIEPCYSTRWASPDEPGYMALHVKTENIPNHQAPKTHVYRGISPKDLQMIREQIPLFKEMLRGFRFKFQVEAYSDFIVGKKHSGLPAYLSVRGTSEPTAVSTIIDISDSDIDRNGRNILENEEVMVDVVRGDFGGPGIRAELDRYKKYRPQEFHFVPRVPFLYEDGLTWQTARRCFKPSEFHYKKYFDGKTKSQGGNVEGK